MTTIQERREELDSVKIYVKFQDGENQLRIDKDVEPTKSPRFGGYQYQCVLNGKAGIITLPKTVEKVIVEGLLTNKTNFTVTKKGEGMKTTYAVR